MRDQLYNNIYSLAQNTQEGIDQDHLPENTQQQNQTLIQKLRNSPRDQEIAKLKANKSKTNPTWIILIKIHKKFKQQKVQES